MRTKKTRDLPSRRAFLAGAACAGIMACMPAAEVFAAAAYQQTALIMGTIVRVDVAGAAQSQAEEAVASCFARARSLESLLTRFNSASALGVLNSQGSLGDVPPELAGLLDLSGKICRLTQGSFDPSILPVLNALRQAEEQGVTLSSAELNELLARVDYSRVHLDGTIRLDEGMSLTLDGIAKGYIAQEMSSELTRLGCRNHLVNAGGDIIASGAPARGTAWRVGVRSPFSGQALDDVIAMKRGALATSGVYEQPVKGGSGSHLVIPTNLSFRPEVVSASVLASDGAQADALATAFSVMAPRTSLSACERLDGVEAMLVLRSGSIMKSAGWPA